MGLIIFFVHYYIFLRERDDRRVQNVKLLLLTATKEGPVVDAIERLLTSAEVPSEEFCVLRGPGRLGLAHCPQGVQMARGVARNTRTAPRIMLSCASRVSLRMAEGEAARSTSPEAMVILD